MARRRDILETLPGAFEVLRADYAAAKTSRFRRRRGGFVAGGSGADYHYRSVGDYLRMIEQAREMDRNDAIVGSCIDRATLNAVQDGIAVDPQTGDAALDADLWARFDEWATDPDQADAAGERTWPEIQETTYRAMLADGDCFANLTADGPVELIEGHRCRTPSNTTRNVVHGVLLDSLRRRREYWFTADDIEPLATVQRVAQMRRIDARDPQGHRNLLHVYNPKRISQTRGVSALTPIVDLAGMFEDLNFAKLVQAQIVSCFAIFRERDGDFRGSNAAQAYGPRGSETMSDGVSRTVEGIAPGMQVDGQPGERLQGFSPNVPNAEFFPHVRLILALVGINLGLPLVMVLMDAGETNFSGWRGAVDQARMGFRRNQRWLVHKLCAPIYRWKLRQFIADDAALRSAEARLTAAHRRDRTQPTIYAHRWNPPRWPYIQPLQDAQADAVRLEAMQTSPRRLHAERGQDWDDVFAEMVEDNGAAIEAAIARAQAIRQRTGVTVDWHELLHLPSTDSLRGTLVTDSQAGGGNEGARGGAE